MSSLVKEFKDFVTRGNLVDLAVAFVLGAAFVALVKSFTDNVLMPIIAIPFGEPNFDSALRVTINGATISIGAFITTLVTFLLTALVLFFVVKAYNAFRRGAPSEVTNEVNLLKDIRAELQKMNEKGGEA
jgi:large conductance mechanosensitive channel